MDKLKQTGVNNISQQTGKYNYVLPPVSMLNWNSGKSGENIDNIGRRREILQRTLELLSVDGKVTGVITGPRVTRFAISGAGISFNSIANIEDNIATNLESRCIRILKTGQRCDTVSVEVPNSTRATVYMRAVIETELWQNTTYKVPIVLGMDIVGCPVMMDLAQASNLLIAGAACSGKSVCINVLIASLLLKFSPNDLQMIMINQSPTQLDMYQSLPHLITPIIEEVYKVLPALRWTVNEIKRRYKLMAKAKTTSIEKFNDGLFTLESDKEKTEKPVSAKMPRLVIIINDLTDIMLSDDRSDVERSIAYIARQGRGVGIHIVAATSGLASNIITNVIRANLPTKIAFKVHMAVESRAIINRYGAEKLLGFGDMLFVSRGNADIERIQGAFVDDQDVVKIVEFCSMQAKQDFNNKVSLLGAD